MGFIKSMPWQNNSGGNDGGGPWGAQQPPQGSGPQGGGSEPPKPTPPKRPLDSGPKLDLEGGLAALKSHFDRMMGSGPGRRQLGILAALTLFALWMLSGLYRVQPDEQGIPKVFGKATAMAVGPGLHYVWPAPIGSVLLPRTGTENRISVPDAEHGSTDKDESLMLTSDENIIDIKFDVFWKINDPIRYEFAIRDQEHTITRAAESAIREVIGETPIQTALTEGREEVAEKTRQVLQSMLDDYGAGVTVDSIKLQTVSPPQEVVDAFNDVQRARQEGESTRNDAESYRNSILPKAEGEAARKRQDAVGYQAEVVNRAKGDADRFKAVYDSYAAAKDVTARRLYLETMETILQHARKIVTDTPAGTPVVLPMMPQAATGDAK